jgi:hypothetical protein
MAGKRKKLHFKDKDLWYLVGLIATDGCLSSDGQHIDITAKDKDFLESLKKSLELENRIGTKKNGGGMRSHRIQFANRDFYDFLVSIGLTAKKSLTLGALKVPITWFPDFLRGVIDGDGGIRHWIHPSNNAEQWSLKIHSAAPGFIHWLEETIEKRFLVAGQVHKAKTGVYVLKYGKMAAKRICQNCYYEACLGLERKIDLAKMCNASNTGWSKSKTVYCEV